MTDIAFSSGKPSFSPLGLQDRSLGWQVGAVVLGTLFLALASYIEVPMVPVPVTMQTFAVTLIGALYGWRLGAITISAWLVEGAVGFPVLAGGAAGMVGWLAERGWNGNRVVLAFAAMLLGNLACLVLGTAWLAVIIGAEKAITFGFLPFLLGGLLKSALGAATLKLFSGYKPEPTGLGL